MYWNMTDKVRLIEAFNAASFAKLTEDFLKDLLTKGEIKTCETRLLAASMLRSGATYKDVRMITKLSSTTIARIAKSMKNREGGFQKILYKMNPNDDGYEE